MVNTVADQSRSAPMNAAAKPWLHAYPPGVPEFIAPSTYSSLAAFIEAKCAEHGELSAFTSFGKTISFADLEILSGNIGGWLQAQGLQKGDSVAVMLPNILQYPVIVSGILRAGLTVVNVNPLYTPSELRHQLNDSGAKAIFVLENFASTVEKVIADTPLELTVVTTMGDLLGLKGHLVNFVVRNVKKLVPQWHVAGHHTFKKALAAEATLTPVEIKPDDTAFLQYTGGTTGVSKGAQLSHANLIANIEQMVQWLQPAKTKKGHQGPMVYLCALPLYHIFALTVNMFMGVAEGAQNILIANPRDIPAFVKDIKTTRFHVFPGLNTLFNALLNNEDFRKLDFSGLLLTFGGGMAVQSAVAEKWEALTGCIITEGYGLSETAPVATANRTDGTEFTGTIGVPLPSTEVEIRDDAGNTLPAGEPGEICIRGPQVMLGYWQRPDETEKVMTADGFFRSGDIGILTESGHVKIVDRLKDMILVSGFNVYPNEVEEVAAKLDGVLECAAIGVPDENSGEVVKLFVVKSDPDLSEEAIKAHCAKALTNYKRPKHIAFRDALPKSNVGKILRKELRE